MDCIKDPKEKLLKQSSFCDMFPPLYEKVGDFLGSNIKWNKVSNISLAVNKQNYNLYVTPL